MERRKEFMVEETVRGAVTEVERRSWWNEWPWWNKWWRLWGFSEVERREGEAIFGFWRMKKMGRLVWIKGQFRF